MVIEASNVKWFVRVRAKLRTEATSIPGSESIPVENSAVKQDALRFCATLVAVIPVYSGPLREETTGMLHGNPVANLDAHKRVIEHHGGEESPPGASASSSRHFRGLSESIGETRSHSLHIIVGLSTWEGKK